MTATRPPRNVSEILKVSGASDSLVPELKADTLIVDFLARMQELANELKRKIPEPQP
jgi:hypothetical protein